jgi:hypothetical protein
VSPGQQWARCRPWIEAALPYGGGFFEIADVEAMIADGDAIFWPGEGCAIVTQFWTMPRTRVLNFWLAGGDMAEIVGVLRPRIEQFAAANGCGAVVIAGRKGWQRVLRPHGHIPLWTAYMKELA